MVAFDLQNASTKKKVSKKNFKNFLLKNKEKLMKYEGVEKLKYFKWCLNLDPISINVLNQSSLCLKSAYFGEIGLN